MSRISSAFTQTGHTALIAYVTVGYPSIEDTLEAAVLLAENGCDIVELGVPFSDPLADGATIQRASFGALQKGVNLRLCIDVAKQLSTRIHVPLVLMTYFNPVLSYGLEEFGIACEGAGISGVIIPDLPPDEASDLEVITHKHNLDLIYLLSPASTDERLRLVARRSRGFIYLVSVTGVTGIRDRLPQQLESFVRRVRKVANQPLCVGFGISTPEQAGQVARIADGVIMGSKIVQLMESDGGFLTLPAFIKKLRNAIDHAKVEERHFQSDLT